MSTERGQGELVEVLVLADCADCGHGVRLHEKRGCLADGDNPAGYCPCMKTDDHVRADALQAHVDAEVAAALEGAAVDLSQWWQADMIPAPTVVTYLRNKARIVREQIPTSGGGAV